MSRFSDDYHDFVFKDGKLLGQFDEMYRYSKEVPWHQDKTAHQVFVDLDITILKHFLPKLNSCSICDLGCGLGYVSARLYAELSPLFNGLDVTGIDISQEAVARARLLHPHMKFHSVDISRDDVSPWFGKFDLLYIKDILWYVTADAEHFFDKAKALLKADGAIYMMQSVPDRASFIGSDTFPSTFSIAEFLSKDFVSIYVSSTYEIDRSRIVGDYTKDKYLRFLGRIRPTSHSAP